MVMAAMKINLMLHRLISFLKVIVSASYNAACSYADELMSSGKISGYEVKPTGDGVQVVCY
ncbi:hypothetical protein SD457_12600 [Coprobacillaceae bacterium CR2/5/TPMF4]|nr:hypothetical protein SD457_12600 [Coprobacillaceae bacterium CR2/5/TPMF4]